MMQAARCLSSFPRAETIGRMGIIALTSGIEMDMYGNVNSSHIAGTQVVNGLGGGANFAENAALSILLMPSENKGGAFLVQHCPCLFQADMPGKCFCQQLRMVSARFFFCPFKIRPAADGKCTKGSYGGHRSGRILPPFGKLYFHECITFF